MPAKPNHPVPASVADVDSYDDVGQPADWGPSNTPPASSGPKLSRYLNALKRFKWLILLFVIAGAAGGYSASRLIEPEYEVQAAVMLDIGASMGGGPEPIQTSSMLDKAGYLELFKSFAVSDPVVTRLGLFIEPQNQADSVVFRDFRLDPLRPLRPGGYRLTIANQKFLLEDAKSGFDADSGAVGDSIGRHLGFAWAPTPETFAGRDEVSFVVETPREVSVRLGLALLPAMQLTSPIIKLKLTGKNSARLAATLNAWCEQFVAEATAQKRKTVSTLAGILNGQRDYAQQELRNAESALEEFKVRTITEPNDRVAVNAGLDMTSPPVINDYFNKKISQESLQRDRANLEKILADGKAGRTIAPEAVFSIPLVNSDPASQGLRAGLGEQVMREQSLRKRQETFTDEDRVVKGMMEQLQEVRTKLVPRELENYIAQLRLREGMLTSQIENSGKELKGIPIRAIEEQKLNRAVAVAEALYKSLDMKTNQAKLSEASTVPDVQVLDSATAPLTPTKNTAPVIIFGVVGAALGLGVLLAILIDTLDKRFRYPEQATDDLGLYILGVVPVIGGKGGTGDSSEAAQVVEAFRSIRMNVRYAADPGRALAVTITSPGPDDGKSLISSNLALSFAESGARTLLIDGDIRRGELSKTFGTKARPGLIEYLDGAALIAEVLQPTASHPNLTVMSSGARRRRAPELLATPRLPQLIAQLAGEYDVIVVDSPPLGAGFDAYALAASTGNMALVLRTGVTDIKMAKAKLATVDTLPIRIMGCVLNGIKLSGVYQYYSYYQDYHAQDEETPRVAAGPERTNVPVPVDRS